MVRRDNVRGAGVRTCWAPGAGHESPGLIGYIGNHTSPLRLKIVSFVYIRQFYSSPLVYYSEREKLEGGRAPHNSRRKTNFLNLKLHIKDKFHETGICCLKLRDNPIFFVISSSCRDAGGRGRASGMARLAYWPLPPHRQVTPPNP